MSIPFADLLARLEGVRRVSDTEAVAKCPAHNDRSPSLSVRHAGDRLLVHCHAGCPTEDVMSAVGLTMAALMPERPLTDTHTYLQRPSLSPSAALALLGHELEVAVMLTDGIASNYSTGERPNFAAAERLAECAARIAKVRSLAREIGTPDEVKQLKRGEYTP